MIGKVGPFEGDDDEWDHYVERLSFYFTANKITDKGQQRAVLLSVCGAKTYKIIRNLLAPTKPDEVEYKDIVDKVKDHLNPKPSCIVQRFRFNCRSRSDGETIGAFIAELRRLTEDCEFGEALHDMLRDRLVCGVKNARIQKRLLQETNLKFEDALKIARAMETADKNSAEMYRPLPVFEQSQNDAVHQTSSGDGEVKPKCFRCLGTHSPSNCRFKTAECWKCKKVGHVARACKSQKATGKTHQVSAEAAEQAETTEGKDSPESEVLYSVHVVGQQHNKEPLIATVTINHKQLRMEIDTGASVSLISEQTFQTLWTKKHAPGLRRPEVQLRTYSGERLRVLGELDVKVRYGNQVAVLPLIVVRGEGPSLLGRNWMMTLRLHWENLFRTEQPHNVQEERKAYLDVLARYPGLFREELGLLKGTAASLELKPDAKPRFYKSRPIPYAYKETVETEMKRLQKEGTIEPVTFSEWAAPIVPVMKQNGSVRICGDYRLTINQAIKRDSYPCHESKTFSQIWRGANLYQARPNASVSTGRLRHQLPRVRGDYYPPGLIQVYLPSVRSVGSPAHISAHHG